MKFRQLLITALIFAIALSFLSHSAITTNAATPTQFANANSSIGSAFVSVYNAQQSGGNVSSLTDKLNFALILYQRAQLENSSNPTQAALDLRNATSVAQEVVSAASGVGQSGRASRQIQYSESIGSAIVIVVVAALFYIYGGRIYRRIWLYVYRDFVVRPTDG